MNSDILLQLTLPYNQYFPSQFFQCLQMLRISAAIAQELGEPIFSVGFRATNNFTSLKGMLMPETAMHKYNLLLCRKNDVWSTGQIISMQPIPVAVAMKHLTHKKLRLHTNASDRPHIGTTLLR